MSDRTLHIVAFSVPYPANYGGAIDVFFKLKQLHKQGVKIILHCFQYDRDESEVLKQYCQEVHYYERNMNPALQFNPLPFIVASRKNNQLNEKLLKDEHPILLEGLHCCALVLDKKIHKDRIIVRSHNLEHDYYAHLAAAEKNLIKRFYFQLESKKLKRFEKQVYPKVKKVLGISSKDHQYLNSNYGNSALISAFHPFEKVEIHHKEEGNNFALYHGNMAVGENDQAAQFLVNEVFSKINFPLIIAGSKPSSALQQMVKKHKNVSLKADISSNEIHELIASAQINILPTFQSTGIKLKLLAALYKGGHLVVNDLMVEGTGLDHLCTVCYTTQDFISNVQKLSALTFNTEDGEKRQLELEKFSNEHNAKLLVQSIWS